MMEIRKKYSNGEITIVWQPALCCRSAICVTGLPAVFNAVRRPWIDPFAATTQELIMQVDACPTGALSYYWN